jgi:transposase
MGHIDFRSLNAETQENTRRQAVTAIKSGMSIVEAARVFGVTRQAMSNWISLYRSKGSAGLRAHKRGRPAGGRLQGWQAAQITRTIVDRCPDQLKLPMYLWTREAVALLIKRRFGIEVSVWTAGRYLCKWGFTSQKPVRRAFEQDAEEVRRWLEVEYPRLKALAKRDGAEIYWGDEMGLRSDHAAGRSYGRKGKTPVIPGTGKRFGCNMISAITNRGQLYFMVFKSRFQSEVFVRFLQRLCKQVKRRIYLIVDSHPVHRSAVAKRWVEDRRGEMKLFYLPGYSPELNPDEYLNQDVKSNAVGKRRPTTQTEMLMNVRGYLRSTQRQPGVVVKYFCAEPVRYAAM